MTAMMTEKQRQAVAAMEAARSQGCSLTSYARANGLDAQRLHSMLYGLRKRGLLPEAKPKLASPFVAVRVQPERSSVREVTSAVASGSAVVCRIVRRHGDVIECLHWPPPSWLDAMGTRSSDAAP